MPYTIKKTNGETVVVIPDGAIDEASTSLSLVGKNVSGYGFYQNENFLFLLENFANDNPPAEPIVGQVWFDTTVDQLKVYTSYTSGLTTSYFWKGVSNNTVSAVQPPLASASTGDLWFDTTNDQLRVFDGVKFDLIGSSVPGFDKSRLEGSVINGIKDGESSATNNPVLTLYIDGTALAIISKFEFTPTTPIAGLHENSDAPGRVFAGINFIGSTIVNGLTDQTNRFVDTVDGALETVSFVRTDAAQTQVIDNSLWVKDSLVVGDDSGDPLVTFRNYVGDDADPLTDLQIDSSGPRIVFTALTSTGVKDIVMVDGSPQESGESTRISFAPVGTTQVDLGTPNRTFRNLWAEDVIADLTGNVAGNVIGNLNGDHVRVDKVLSRDGLTEVIDNTTATPTLTGNLVGNVQGNVSGATLALTGDANIDGTLTASAITVIGGTADGMDITGGTITNSTLSDVTINNSTIDSPILTGTTVAPTQASSDDSTKIATTAFVHDVLPKGAIIMWGGSTSLIPTGWALCDGSTVGGFTTPDLVNRFILGAGVTGPIPNTTGGSANTSGTTDAGGSHNHTGTVGGTALTTQQIPPHGHIFDDIRWSEVSGSYTYADPMLGNISVGPGAGSNRGTDYDNGAHFIQHGTYSTGGGQTHSHGLTIDGESSHTHTFTVPNTRPPYYVLCFIIKVI